MPPEAPSGIIEDNSGAQKTIGYVIDLRPDAGDVACMLDVLPKHLNRNGMLHGGIMTILLDVACGYAASLSFDQTKIAPVLTVSLNMSYVAPGGEGRVTAIGKVAGGGHKICYANGELRDESGQLIASAACVFKRVNQRPVT
ncbi:MAG: PaaI family thioesterase [Rhodobacteraceae bacterium]|nr:PaaI family thioesterase [Paracoccaceae bacterium]